MPTPPNMGEMMQKLAGLKQKMEDVTKQAAARTAKATVGGGLVSATANGKQEITRIEIEQAAMGDKAMLEDLVAAACNQALAQSKAFAGEEMQKAVAELGVAMPPGFDLSKMF